MVWPETGVEPPEITVPDEYVVRSLREGEEAGHVHVMHKAGFADWTEEKLAHWIRALALPDGVFVALQERTLS